MAATALLTNKTTNGAGAGVSVTGPCSVAYTGDSVFDGARSEVQLSLTDVDAKYSSVGDGGEARGAADGCYVNFTGTYFIRCKVYGAGPTKRHLGI